jgi:PKD repeat protein
MKIVFSQLILQLVGLYLIPQLALALSIEPANVAVKAGELVVFNVHGAASGPYQWRIPAGHIDIKKSAMLYKAPKKAGHYELEVTVGGNKATAHVTVYLDLVVSPTKAQIKSGESRSLQAYGGVPPFSWIINGNGDLVMDETNPAKVTFVSAKGMTETATIEVQDAVGNRAIVPVNVIKPLSVKPENIQLTPKTSQLLQLSGGLPPFTSIVKTGSGKVEDTGTRIVRYTAPAVWGESVLEIEDAARQKLTIPVKIQAPLTASPSRISLEKEAEARFQISGGEPPYRVMATQGIPTCDQMGECTYTAPAHYGPDVVVVNDQSQNRVAVQITVEGGIPTILPANPTLKPGETGVFTVEGGCSPLWAGEHPYEWAWEADIVLPASETGQVVYVRAPEQEGFYTLMVQDACGVKQEVIVNVTTAGETPPVAQFIIKPRERVEVEELVFFDAKTDKDPEGNRYNYRWDFGDNTSDSGFRASHEYQTAGRYDVKLTVTDEKGQQGEAVISVVVLPPVPKVRTEPAQAALYPGDNLALKMVGGIPPYTMTAERGQLTQTQGQTTIYIAPDITGPDQVLVTDQNGKSARAAIEVLREIQVTPIIPLIYPGVKQRFNVMGGKGPYSWKTTVGEIHPIDSPQHTEIDLVVPDASRTPIITVTDANKKSFNAYPRISTKIRLSPTEVALKQGELHHFTAHNGVGTINWHTTSGELTQTEGSSTSYKAPKVAGRYRVLASDSLGNSAEAAVYVNLLPAISPLMSVLQTGEETTFRVFRGVPPYTWTVRGAGEIRPNQKGDIATFRAAAQAGSTNVVVTDSAGKTVQAIVRVQLPNTFTVSPTEIQLRPEQTTNIQARGADTVLWAVQRGQLNTLEGKRVTYTAPTNNGVDLITATNEKGENSQAIVFIGGRVTGNGVFSSHVDGSVQYPHLLGVLRVDKDKDKGLPKTVYIAAEVAGLGLF